MQKKLVILGGSGFIGTNLLIKLSKLKNLDLHATFFKKKNFFRVPNVKYHRIDLSDYSNHSKLKKILKNSDSVFMLAAISSGAKIMENNSLSLFTPNIKFNLNIVDLCYQLKVNKFVFISSNTVYPVSNRSMREEDVNFSFFEKYYVVGWMKLFTEIICNVYSTKVKESKLKILVVRPSNLFGPFDKYSRTKSKVIASLIRKFYERKKYVEIWGDGSDVKDFLYIEDFCDALLHVYKKFNGFETLNISSGSSIKLIKIIDSLCKYFLVKKNELRFNKNMPTMIPLRKMSNSKLEKKYNYKIKSDLNTSLIKTISWYKENKKIYDNY